MPESEGALNSLRNLSNPLRWVVMVARWLEQSGAFVYCFLCGWVLHMQLESRACRPDPPHPHGAAVACYLYPGLSGVGLASAVVGWHALYHPDWQVPLVLVQWQARHESLLLNPTVVGCTAGSLLPSWDLFLR